MLTLVNNTTMQHIVTTLGMDMPIALAWAETIPYQNDFSILTHVSNQFTPYTDLELYTLYNSLKSLCGTPTATSREDFIRKLINELNNQPITSEPPPDVKRVAPLKTKSESKIMTTSKDVSKKAPGAAKKAAAKKPAVKKTLAKKPAVKKAATKKPAAKKAPVEKRERKNGMLLPRPDSTGGKVWAIADKLSKKAGAPPARKDVMDDCVKAGFTIGCAGGYYQDWRRYHGLVKKVVADTKLKLNTTE